MSVWNPFAFDVLGKPMTFAAPPALRVMGGQASAGQLAAAQAIFARFSAAATHSHVPNPSEGGSLSDGSVYKITSVGPQTIMQLWPKLSQSKKTVGGILVIYEGIASFRVWWDSVTWRAEQIEQGFFGRGYQRIPKGGAHFTEMFPTYFNKDGVDRFGPTKLSGTTTSAVKQTDKALAIQSSGYLMESGIEWQSFGLVLANSPENFVFLNVLGTGYEVFATASMPKPSDTPAVATELVAAGDLAVDGFFEALAPLARRGPESFVLPAPSMSAPPALEVIGGFREYVDFFKPTAAEILISEIRSTSPYALSSSRKPVLTDRWEDMYLESECLPEIMTRTGEFIHATESLRTSPDSNSMIYTGFPVKATATIGIQYASEGKWADSSSYSAGEKCWIRECVDFNGTRYSAGVRYSGRFMKQLEQKTRREGQFVSTFEPRNNAFYCVSEVPGYSISPPSGPSGYTTLSGGTLQGAVPPFHRLENDTTVYTNQLSAYLDLGRYSVPLTEIDLTFTTGRFSKSANPAASGVSDEWGNVPPSIAGSVIARKVAAIEERSYLVVLYETEMKKLTVSYLQGMGQDAQIRYELESRLVMYVKGAKVFSEVLGTQAGSHVRSYSGAGRRPDLGRAGSHLFEAELGAIAGSYVVRYASGWVDSPGGGYYTSPGITQGGVAPIISENHASVALYSAYRKEEGAAARLDSLALEIIDYRRSLDVVAAQAVISPDPTSGGCLVMASGKKLLVSPGGAVTHISSVTGKPDTSLREMTACL